ncbi:MAG: DUF2585 family protein [Hyphomicrobiales bacterium]|nr:DUF2585 family protein [Hyphomicrobiales bacterium]
MGQPWIAPSGPMRFWGGDEHSQHIIDWYTPSHIVHGFFFYFILWLVARQRSLGIRALIAVLIEAAWEIIENTPWIINRYREVTVSADYVGDTVLNSVFDVVAMLVGFVLAARLPVWLSILLAIVLELAAAWAVRDNLTLNVIMLIYPSDAILAWQAGG